MGHLTQMGPIAMTSSPARDRNELAIDQAILQEEFRLVSYLVVGDMLETNRIWREYLGLDNDDLMVLLNIALANVQRFMRDRVGRDPFLANVGIPQDAIVPISRRAIARATGLPRETVRRRVDRLIAEGLVVELTGGVRSRPRILAETNVIAALIEHVERLTGTTNALLDRGVLTLRRNR